jgi:hypothetical protein
VNEVLRVLRSEEDILSTLSKQLSSEKVDAVDKNEASVAATGVTDVRTEADDCEHQREGVEP